MTTTKKNALQALRDKANDSLSQLQLLCYLLSQPGDIPTEVKVMGLHMYVEGIMKEVEGIGEQLERLEQQS